MTRSFYTRLAASMVMLLIVLPLSAANTPGMFRGVLVENPTGAGAPTGIIYLRARNGNVRKVEMSKAVISYDDSVPKEQQSASASEALKPGADVRVTAEQESDGEWHASRIDILGKESTPQSIDTDSLDDDDDGYTLEAPGSTRPVMRKG